MSSNRNEETGRLQWADLTIASSSVEVRYRRHGRRPTPDDEPTRLLPKRATAANGRSIPVAGRTILAISRADVTITIAIRGSPATAAVATKNNRARPTVPKWSLSPSLLVTRQPTTAEWHPTALRIYPMLRHRLRRLHRRRRQNPNGLSISRPDWKPGWLSVPYRTSFSTWSLKKTQHSLTRRKR